MIRIEINNIPFLVKSNLSALEACKYVGVHLPRFCYHESLSVSGNCRMCIVELANSPKPIAACALPITNNIKIYIDTPLVKKARENILEALLLNHPLDCPICDQAGECDLQDQAFIFGNDLNRFRYAKRSVEDKFFNPLIKTIMTRCIHCTRCVRFSSEIAGVETIGTLNRGIATEIGTYKLQEFNSELSGNIIDLCPVGALTSRPYAYTLRPWEIRVVESIDISDSLGSNIYVHTKDIEIQRITPKYNKSINGNLISDKARFSYDSNRLGRCILLQGKRDLTIERPQEHIFPRDDFDSFLDWCAIVKEVPPIVKKESNSLTWDDLLIEFETVFYDRERLDSILIVVNERIDTNLLQRLTRLALSFPNRIKLKNIDSASNTSNFYNTWHFNTLNIFEQHIKTCILVSTNLRIESAILNAKIRLKRANSNITTFSSSLPFLSTFNINFINFNPRSFIDIVAGKNKRISKLLINTKTPMFVLGDSLKIAGFSLETLMTLLRAYLPTSVVLNSKAKANTAGLNFLNCRPFTLTDLTKTNRVYAIHLEESSFISKYFFNQNKRIYWFTTHNSFTAQKATAILPLVSHYEEEQIFLNMENRPQKTLISLMHHEDTRSLSGFLNVTFLPFLAKPYKFFDFNLELTKNSTLFNLLHKNLIFSPSLTINLLKTICFHPIKFVHRNFYRTSIESKNSLILSYTRAKTLLSDD